MRFLPTFASKPPLPASSTSRARTIQGLLPQGQTLSWHRCRWIAPAGGALGGLLGAHWDVQQIPEALQAWGAGGETPEQLSSSRRASVNPEWVLCSSLPDRARCHQGKICSSSFIYGDLQGTRAREIKPPPSVIPAPSQRFP